MTMPRGADATVPCEGKKKLILDNGLKDSEALAVARLITGFKIQFVKHHQMLVVFEAFK